MAAQTEDEFLTLIAQRPDDRSLRLVFCDWLLERGDPRGEAMALYEKGSGMQGALASGERRRLTTLQAANARKWLGPLTDVVALDADGAFRCRFAGGLLQAVRFSANLPLERYQALTGEPRLATVESLAIDPGRATTAVGQFLAHPVLAQVTTLEIDAGTLLGTAAIACAPSTLQVMIWDPVDELGRLAKAPAFAGATTLRVSTVEFFIPDFAEIFAEVVISSGVLRGRRQFEVITRYATIEGAARWLRLASARVRGLTRGSLERWGVHYAELYLSLEGDEFEQFVIDLGDEGEQSVGTRLATAAAVLVMLEGIGLKRVEVRSVPGGRVRPHELNALRAAVRRLTNLEEFKVAGVLQSP